MKKNIEIKKRIEFSSMIGEICAISLENHLKFVDNENVSGTLELLGSYKTTVASQIEEKFHYDIPVDIALTNEVDASTGKIDITDFYYDITDGNCVLCHIEITIDALEILKEERECDGDSSEQKEMEIPHIEDFVSPLKMEEKIDFNREEENSIEETVYEKDEDSHGIFNLSLEEETYGTFIVYMVRQNETINSIIEKYNTSLEEIEKYNDIKDLTIGSKVIIPIAREQDI